MVLVRVVNADIATDAVPNNDPVIFGAVSEPVIVTERSSLTINEATALEFSTRRAVVADVVPEPRTWRREDGEEVPIPIPTSPVSRIWILVTLVVFNLRGSLLLVPISMLAPKYLTYPISPAVGLTIVIWDPAEPEIRREPVVSSTNIEYVPEAKFE